MIYYLKFIKIFIISRLHVQYGDVLFIADTAVIIILFSGLFLIGFGCFWKHRLAHIIRLIGLFLFAVFWLIWTFEYLFFMGNYYNSAFTILGIIFLLYMVYHEYLDYIWKEETYALKWFAGVIFVSGFVYYIIAYNPIVAGALIYLVAWITITVMNGFGILPTGETLYLDKINYSDPSHIWVAIPPVGINIILACTAIQAILIFVAVISFVNADQKKKLKVLLVTTGIIFSLNIVRNVSTIWLVGTNTMSFYFAHEVLGKTFSLIILLILAFWTFKQLPEILDNIFGLIDLRFRDKAGMVVDGFVVLPETGEYDSKKSSKKHDGIDDGVQPEKLIAEKSAASSSEKE